MKIKGILLLLLLFAFISVTLPVEMKTACASNKPEYTLKGNIPMFSFEEPVKLQVKVFDQNGNEVKNATVIFEISPAATPPPYGHDKEMGYMEKIMNGQTEGSEVQEYLHYLHNLKVAPEKSIHKIAAYDSSTGYYTATHVFPRLPWGIKVYVAGSDGDFQKIKYFFPHRSHCAFIDVTNIELLKTQFHQLINATAKGDWQTVEQKLNSIKASLNGKHGMYYMLNAHHGEDISRFRQQMGKLEDKVSKKSSKDVATTVQKIFITLQEYEDYFGTIHFKRTEKNPYSYEVTLWDNINKKGITNALVIIQEKYNVKNETINPVIVPFQAPNKGMYHAKISHIPNGILAKEVGNGKYIFTSKNFGLNNSPKRIFVYYFIDVPEIPSKFITKEINDMRRVGKDLI